MNTRHRIFATALACVLLTAGCTNGGQQAGGPSTAPTGPSATSRSPAPLLQLDDPDSNPAGQLLVATQGRGMTRFSLPSLTNGTFSVTVKMVCAGPGTASVTDTSGGDVLDIGGCDGTAVYGSSWTSSAKDRTLTLTVDAGCGWRLAIWADPK